MREIKFRAWDNEENRMVYIGNPFYSYYPISDDGMRYEEAETDEGFYFCVEQKRWIFEQYTGLRDCNCKDIYEGDLIVNGSRNGKKPHEVVFHNGKFCGTYGKNNLSYDLFYELHEIEIIGNIHDNSELLNG